MYSSFKATVLQEDTSFKHMMKVLIVFVHESRKSFNGGLLDAAVQTLTKAGHEVTVSDLYGMRFNSTPSQRDIKDGAKNLDGYDYANEMKEAFTRGTLADDIVAEQKKVTDADLVIFQFPMNWFSWPAMLKGWIDRVLSNGFAFSFYPEIKLMDKGVFTQKRAVLSITTGSGESSYSESGLNGSMSVYLWPLHATLKYIGFQVLSPHISFGVKFAPEEQRKGYISSWQTRLGGSIWTEAPLSAFFGMADFDLQTFALKDDVVAKKKKEGNAPTVGQHLGLALKTPWKEAL